MGRRKTEEPFYDDPAELYIQIYQGKRKRFPSGYFRYDTNSAAVHKIVRYFITDILGYRTREDILRKIRKQDFYNHKLAGLVAIKYSSSPSLAAMDAFPELDMQPWEFHECHNNYWAGEGGEERAVEAFRFMFHQRMGLFTKEEILPHLNHEKIRGTELVGAFKVVFESNLYLCAEKCFPGMFKEWEPGEHVVNNYWTKEKGIKALRWLFDEHLRFTRDEILAHFSRNFAKKHQMYGMLQTCFNSNVFEALDAAYPGEYKIWEVIKVPKDYWNETTVKDALDWALYKKLNITHREALRLTQRDLVNIGLFGLVMYQRMPVNRLISKYFPEVQKQKSE